MEKDRGSSKPDDPFEIDWRAHGSGADSGESAAPPEGAGAEQRDLPVEPAPPWEDAEAAGYDAAGTLTELLRFHRYGKRDPHSVPDADTGGPVPALLYAYRNLDSIRYEYPICTTDAPDLSVRPLTEIIDQLIAGVVEEGDVGERRRRHILQLETAIREALDPEARPRLLELWERAAGELLELAPSDEKRELLEQSFAAARAALKTDGMVLSCVPETPRRIFLAAAAESWEAKCASWRDELESLVLRAGNVLVADESHKADLNSPEHLRDATAAGDMDYDKLSDLLKQSRLGEPLPEARRSRIQHALDAITKVKPLFDGRVPLFDAGSKLPFDVRPVHNACSAALDRYHARMKTMVEFFKALQIAGLEVENRYREQIHDRFFAQYDRRHLTDEEILLCPPAILVLDEDFFVSPDLGGLMELLSSGVPVKVFAEVSDLASSDTRDVTGIPGWRARLAAMAMTLGDVYVTQATISSPRLVQRGCKAALDYNGAALMSVFNGNAEDHSSIPNYLRAASATESRLFPSFAFDPGAGSTLADRMVISHNSRCDAEWPSDQFSYRDHAGKQRGVALAFTPADFVFLDIRFSAHFWAVAPAKWHANMVPLHEFLHLSGSDAESRIPYLMAVDKDGQLARVVVTNDVVRMVRRVASAWKGLQESGGVDNSHALNLLAAEKARLDEEQKRQVAEIEKKYAADLDRDLGALTQEIVQRIAAGLLSEGGMPSTLSALPAVAAAPPPVTAPARSQTAAEPAPAADEEDEPAESFDDPYIDTPLCTSCNDCTDINAKLFSYDGNKQAFINDQDAGTFRHLVMAAEKCPVHIIHPGKPRNPSEPGLDELIKRAEPYN